MTFCRLAKENYDEAYRLFYSSNFKNLIREDKDRILYEGLRMRAAICIGRGNISDRFPS